MTYVWILLLVFFVIVSHKVAALEKKFHALSKKVKTLTNEKVSPTDTEVWAQDPSIDTNQELWVPQEHTLSSLQQVWRLNAQQDLHESWFHETSSRPEQISTGWEKRNIVVSHPAVNTSSSATIVTNTWYDTFGKWLVTNWQMKLGGLIFLLGLIWWVSYAFANNWVGPEGRIALGIGVGILFMLWGYFRLAKSADQGVVLLSLGGVSILITLYLARLLFGFFSPGGVLLYSLMTVAVLTGVALQKNHRRLAIVSFMLWAIAPLLIHTVDPSFLQLFAYLFALCAGTLWVVSRTGWSLLSFLAVLIYGLYSFKFIVPGTSYSLATDTLALLFASAFFFLFFVTNIMDLLHHEGEVASLSLIAAWMNALLYLRRVGVSAPDAIKSIILFVIAMVFFAVVYGIYSRTKISTPVYVYGALALLFLWVATAFEFSGPALTIAYMLEVTVGVFLLLFIAKKPLWSQFACLGYIIPLLVSWGSFTSSQRQLGIMHQDFVVVLLFVLVFFVLSFVFVWYEKYGNLAQEKRASFSLYTTTTYIIALLFGWVFLHLLFSPEYVQYPTAWRLMSVTSLIWVCTLLSYYVLKKVKWACMTPLLFVSSLMYLPVLMQDPVWNTGVFHTPLYTLIYTTIILFGLGMFVSKKIHTSLETSNDYAHIPFVVTLVLVGILVHLMFSSSVLLYQQEWRLIALILEVFLFVFVSLSFFQKPKRALFIPLLLLWSLFYIPGLVTNTIWASGINHFPFYALLFEVIAVFGLASFVTGEKRAHQDTQAISIILYTFGTLLGMRLIRQSCESSFVSEHMAHMVALISYIVLSIAGYAVGSNKSWTYLRYGSGMVIGLVVLRLLLIEVWQMALGWRIITFLVIGALLLSSAFLIKLQPKQDKQKNIE